MASISKSKPPVVLDITPSTSISMFPRYVWSTQPSLGLNVILKETSSGVDNQYSSSSRSTLYLNTYSNEKPCWQVTTYRNEASCLKGYELASQVSPQDSLLE